MNVPITSSEERTVATIEGSEGKAMPSETLSNMQETPKVIQETRAETEKRRCQQFLDNFDAESYKLVADNLLESRFRHYDVLRRYGMVFVQENTDTNNKEDTFSESSEGFNLPKLVFCWVFTNAWSPTARIRPCDKMWRFYFQFTHFTILK